MRDCPNKLIVLASLVLSFSATAVAPAADVPDEPRFTITDLGTLGGFNTVATAMNESGMVVGWSNTGNDAMHAFVWTPNKGKPGGVIRDLGTLGGQDSRANDINDNGDIVGASETNTQNTRGLARTRQSFICRRAGKMEALPPKDYYQAVGINNAGDLLVTAGSSMVGQRLYRGGRQIDLGKIRPMDLNNLGEVVGGDIAEGPTYAVTFIDGQPQRLDFEGGRSSTANAISDTGYIGGWCTLRASRETAMVSQAFLLRTKPAQPAVVGESLQLFGAGTIQVRGVNAEGQCVGDRIDGAFYFDGKKQWDLGSRLVDGKDWQICHAVAINKAGQIAGIGWNRDKYHSFLLTPTTTGELSPRPEPRVATMTQQIEPRIGPNNYYARWLPDRLILIGGNTFGSYNTNTGEAIVEPTKFADSGPQINQQTTGFVDRKGQLMLTLGAQGKQLRVWDIAKNEKVADITAPEEFFDADLSSDGTRVVVACGGKTNQTALLYDAKAATTIGSPMRHASRIMRVRFSPDGRRIVTVGTDPEVRIWDGTTAAPVAQIKLQSPHEAMFDPSGRRLAVVCSDSLVIVDVASGKTVWQLSLEPMLGRHMSLSPDGKLLAVTGDMPMGDGLMRYSATIVVDLASGRRVTGLLRHDGGMGSLGLSGANFSPDNQLLVTHSDTGRTTRVWDLTHGGQPFTEPMVHPRMVSSASFDVTGTRITTVCTDGIIRLWKLPREIAPP